MSGQERGCEVDILERFCNFCSQFLGGAHARRETNSLLLQQPHKYPMR